MLLFYLLIHYHVSINARLHFVVICYRGERESILCMPTLPYMLCTIRGANERASFLSRLIEMKMKYKYVHAVRCLISLFETAIFITLRCGKFSVFGHVERVSSNFLIC